MAPSRKRWFLAVILIAIAAAVWFTKHDPPSAVSKTGSPPVNRTRSIVPDREKEQATANTTARRRIEEDWAELLLWLRSDPAPTADEVRARLKVLRIAWTAMDPQVLAEVLGRLLATGEDAATGLEFRVGNHGFLSDWPAARVFLLDVLAASDPEMAQVTARRILDQTSSAEEFATGLRSLTRQGMGRAEDAELLSRFGQMLGRAEWQGSRGFAEALDLARFVGTPDAARQLASWNGKQALKSMAMNEFAAEHPDAMLQILGPDSTVDGATRANLMARANPEDPAQLSAVDVYLRSPDRSPEEASVFLKSFPLRSATTGYRLYGRTPSPYSYERIAAGDRKAGEMVSVWVADPALEKYRPDLLALQQRLSKWIEQAK